MLKENQKNVSAKFTLSQSQVIENAEGNAIQNGHVGGVARSKIHCI